MKTNKNNKGFSLVEVTLSLGVMGLCMSTLIGLLSTGLSSNQNAVEQTAGANVANAIIADLRNATPGLSATGTGASSGTNGTAGTSPRYKFKLPKAGDPAGTPQTLTFGEDGSPVGDVGSAVAVVSGTTPRYFASVSIVPPASGKKAASSVRVVVSWPALGNKANALPANYAGYFETVSALDCN